MLTILFLMIIVAISLDYYTVPAQLSVSGLEKSVNVLSEPNHQSLLSQYSGSQNLVYVRWLWTRATAVLLLCTFILVWESTTMSLNTSLYLFNGYIIKSTFIDITYYITILLSSSFILFPISNSNRKNITISFNYEREVCIFLISMLLGSTILAMSTDTLTFLLGLELQSYSVYILAGSTRSIESPEEPSAFAGLKYFLLGAMSSALVFMGLGLLYLFSGSTSLSNNFSLAASLDNDILYCYLGYSLVYAGLLWKIAAAPVHAWSVDVYDALPNRIAAIVSLIPKVAIITILARFTISIISCTYITPIIYINTTVICLSLIIGAVGGLYQSRIKRLLAYSSILNMGFILMIINSCSYYHSQYVISMYLLQYVLSTGGIWLCINSIRTYDLILISQLQGLGNIQGKLSNCQCLAISLTILVLSVAGIPPMIGFFAKFEVIYLAISSNSLYLAFIAIIASLISTVYYLRIVKNIWFVKSRKDLYWSKGNSVTGLNTGIAISISFIILFLLTFILHYPILYTLII